MFLRRFLLLTPSYLARNDCPFGSHTHCGVVRLLNKLFCLGISACLLSPSIFLRLVAQMSLAVAQLKIRVWLPLEKKNPFCVRFLLFPPIYQTPLLTVCFFILKSCYLVVRCYMFCDVRSVHCSTNHTSTHLLNAPKFFALAF